MSALVLRAPRGRYAVRVGGSYRPVPVCDLARVLRANGHAHAVRGYNGDLSPSALVEAHGRLVTRADFDRAVRS